MIANIPMRIELSRSDSSKHAKLSNILTTMHRYSSVILCLACLTWGAASVQGQSESVIISNETKQEQLVPGKTPGTFAFSYSGLIEFSQEPAFPAIVSILDRNDSKKPNATLTVVNSKPFTISADLAPGSYWIGAAAAPDKQDTYWNSPLITTFISPTGLRITNDPLGRMILLKKMSIVGPGNNVVVSETHPILKWQALEGATRYRVNWFVERPGGDGGVVNVATTADTNFQLKEDILPDCLYEWNVWATKADGAELGYCNSSYFFTLGGKEAFASAHLNSGAFTPPQRGTPYLGISPFRVPDMHPEKPATSQAGGITVMSVLAGSPALACGLQPQDVIISFGNKSLSKSSGRNESLMLLSLNPRSLL
jgi:hypothetical protein